MLIALAISATADENAAKAMHKLCELKNCEMHSSVLLAQVDENVLKKLGVRLTSEPAKNKQSIGILSSRESNPICLKRDDAATFRIFVLAVR